MVSENEGKEDFKMDYFCPLCVKLYEDQTPHFVGNVHKINGMNKKGARNIQK